MPRPWPDAGLEEVFEQADLAIAEAKKLIAASRDWTADIRAQLDRLKHNLETQRRLNKAERQ